VDLLGWLIFLFALLFSLMMHETGHFVAAKKFGMQATRYFVGMGPTIWSTFRGETEYGIKALPIGGFVKITGMTSMDEVDPEYEARSFRRAPGWQRLIVMVAGIMMQFVLAFVLVIGLAMAVGIENDNTAQLGTVAACVPANEKALNDGAACTSSDAKSPAAKAGLRVGDTIVDFDGTKVTSWDQLTNLIKDKNAGSAATVVVDRDGHDVTLHTTLAGVSGRSGGYLGVAASAVLQRASPWGALKYSGSMFWQTLDGTGHSLSTLRWKAITGLFSKDRSQTAAGNVSSVVGLARDTGDAVAAPVGWQYKVEFILLLVAELNIFVGVINLLPLLPLDGGHIAVVLWEMVRSRVARWRRRPDPGLVDYRKVVPVMFSLFMVLALFSVLVMLADIVNPVNIG
jgi:membrane-associated protease RseP (regulator of RpoE activity)